MTMCEKRYSTQERHTVPSYARRFAQCTFLPEMIARGVQVTKNNITKTPGKTRKKTLKPQKT